MRTAVIHVSYIECALTIRVCVSKLKFIIIDLSEANLSSLRVGEEMLHHVLHGNRICLVRV